MNMYDDSSCSNYGEEMASFFARRIRHLHATELYAGATIIVEVVVARFVISRESEDLTCFPRRSTTGVNVHTDWAAIVHHGRTRTDQGTSSRRMRFTRNQPCHILRDEEIFP